MKFVEDALEQNVTSSFGDIGAAHYSWAEAESCALPSLVCVGYGDGGFEAVDFQSHFLAVGQSGSGKTESFVQPTAMLLAFSKSRENVVVGDSKGGVAKNTGPLFESRGYKVSHVNLRGASPDAFNPLLAVFHAFKAGDKSLAEERLAAIVGPLKALVHSDRDVFWEQAFEKLLSATVMAMMEACPQEEPTLSDAADLIGDGIEGLERLASRIAGTAAAARLREALSCKVADKTTASLVIVTQAALDFWSTNAGRELTGRGGVDIEEVLFSETPTCLFVTYPDESVQGKILASILLDQIYNVYVHGYEVRAERGASAGRGVRVCYDEWGMLPRTDMPRLLATSRSRGLFVAVSCQSVSQMLISGYSEAEATTMLSQFGTLLLFRNCDESIANVAYTRTGGVVGLSDLSALSPGRAIVIRNGAPAMSTQLPAFQWLYGESPLSNACKQAIGGSMPRAKRREPKFELLGPYMDSEPCELKVECLDDLFDDADDEEASFAIDCLVDELSEVSKLDEGTTRETVARRVDDLIVTFEHAIYSDCGRDKAVGFACALCAGEYGRDWRMLKLYERCLDFLLARGFADGMTEYQSAVLFLLDEMAREVERGAKLAVREMGSPYPLKAVCDISSALGRLVSAIDQCGAGRCEGLARLRKRAHGCIGGRLKETRRFLGSLCEGIEGLFKESDSDNIAEWFADTGPDGLHMTALRVYESLSWVGVQSELLDAALADESLPLMVELNASFDELFGDLVDSDELDADYERLFDSEHLVLSDKGEWAWAKFERGAEQVQDGEYAAGLESVREACLVNPGLKKLNGVHFVQGMAHFGLGNARESARCLLEYAESPLAEQHVDRDDAAFALVELGRHFADGDAALARELLETATGLKPSSLECRAEAALALAAELANEDEARAKELVERTLDDSEWNDLAQYVKRVKKLRKRLKRMRNGWIDGD